LKQKVGQLMLVLRATETNDPNVLGPSQMSSLVAISPCQPRHLLLIR